MRDRPVYINPRHIVAIVVDDYNYRVILTGRIEVVGTEPKPIKRDNETWYYMEGSVYVMKD